MENATGRRWVRPLVAVGVATATVVGGATVISYAFPPRPSRTVEFDAPPTTGPARPSPSSTASAPSPSTTTASAAAAPAPTTTTTARLRTTGTTAAASSTTTTTILPAPTTSPAVDPAATTTTAAAPSEPSTTTTTACVTPSATAWWSGGMREVAPGTVQWLVNVMNTGTSTIEIDDVQLTGDNGQVVLDGGLGEQVAPGATVSVEVGEPTDQQQMTPVVISRFTFHVAGSPGCTSA